MFDLMQEMLSLVYLPFHSLGCLYVTRNPTENNFIFH